MQLHDAHVSVFTRLPIAGSSKTRLIPVMGAEAAAELQRDMTAHVVRQARIASAVSGCSVEARVTGGPPRAARRWLGISCVEQGVGTLGERLARALQSGLARHQVAAVLGGDCPSVDATDIQKALGAALERGVAVIPATDGGFCLLAARLPALGDHGSASSVIGDCLRSGIDWGTDRVLEQTVSCMQSRGVDVAVLDARSDVDVPADLPVWESTRDAWYARPERLSVVIPVLNEAAALPGLLARVRAEVDEVVLVDGGSTDGSAVLAERLGARVLRTPPGRARQLNAGAAAATGDAVLFLHADSIPPEGFSADVRDVLADPEVLVGAFRFSLGGTGSRRLVEWGTNVRARMGLPYGDQGLFMRRAAFWALGGFPDEPVMEDYLLVDAARRAGRVAIAPSAVTTSARQWDAMGTWRYTGLNTATVMRYLLGATPTELAEWRSRIVALYSKR